LSSGRYPDLRPRKHSAESGTGMKLQVPERFPLILNKSEIDLLDNIAPWLKMETESIVTMRKTQISTESLIK
jgi:hypothetical protein